MKLMPNYLLMGVAGCNDGQNIILHVTLSSNHHEKEEKEGGKRASSSERRWGKREARERTGSVKEGEKRSWKSQTFKHAVTTRHRPGVSIQPTAITRRVTVIK